MGTPHPVAPLFPEPGTLLGGRYRIEEKIGGGGMGVVLAAFDEHVGRRVALKLVHGNAATSARRQRFLREATAAARIESEHVVEVHDAGVFDDERAYLAMELLEGEDLRHALDARERFSAEVAVDLLLQACRAVAAAHAKGIIHRDLKPANLFLARTAEGTVLKVLDFGISKVMVEDDVAVGTLTDTGAAVGSPRYMSPEQVRDAKRVGPASDVWALGVILYELLVGKPPFVAETAPGTYASIIADSPRPIREQRPEIPASLEAICMRCLEKNIEHRYPDVSTLARALESFARGDAAAATVGPSDDGDATLDPTPAAFTRNEPRPPSRSKRGAILLGAGSVGLVVVALAALAPSLRTTTSSVDETPSPQPTTRLERAEATSHAASVASAVAPVVTPSASVPASPTTMPETTARPRATVAATRAVDVPRGAGGRPTPHEVVPPSAAASTPASAACDPPFVIDPNTGTRRVKPGCG